MVNQSDLPFRTLVERYGTTLVYTQMLKSDALLNDQDYLEFHLRDLTINPACPERPVVVQLCGNEPQTVVQAGRKIQNYCHGIDLNLGCPQQAAFDGHFGAYLLGQNDWPLVEQIVSAMAASFTVPTAAKLRICQAAPKTLDLAQRLGACGAAWLTLHARTVAPRRRRHGAADLSQVKRLKDNLSLPVVSNGNVRTWNDLEQNLKETGADGLMVAETLLGNPWSVPFIYFPDGDTSTPPSLFANKVPDPVDISLEYLGICREYPGTATLSVATTHVRHFVEFQWSCVFLPDYRARILSVVRSHRRPWYRKFRPALGACKTLDDVERLLRVRVERWRGRTPRPLDDDEEEDLSDGPDACDVVEDFGSLFLE